ncbi:hypothetical protein R1flu_027298 [Riccia fluitans]|uniref:Gag-pol polyprotein n=1 Tax=Riccia fluitans TaxID=41844 RepID=A0ABD1XIY1_9MARC
MLSTSRTRVIGEKTEGANCSTNQVPTRDSSNQEEVETEVLPPLDVPAELNQFEKTAIQGIENLVLDNPIPRYPTRLRKPSLKVIENAQCNFAIDFCGIAYSDDPLTLSDPFVGSKAKLWKRYVDEEMKSMAENQVWSLMELPPRALAVKWKWVLQKVYNQDKSLA